MKLASSKKTLRAALLVPVAAVAIGVSGCGQGAFDHRQNLHNVSETMIADGGEEYFNAGPITYQVQISRQLNPFSTEDVQYMAGIKNAQNIPGDQLWFGVFLWAKNQTNHPAPTADKFKIVDSEGTIYNAVALNSSVNPFAWTSQTLSPGSVQPTPDSIAANGSTQGGLVLFKLNDSIYANRPLTLEVYPPGGGSPSKVSLDL